MRNFNKQLQNNYILLPFAVILIILSFLYPKNIAIFYKFVDWSTIVILTGLLIITTAIKESHFLAKVVKNILKKIHNERSLALALITFSSVLSMFLTNDIALFIIVPLTLNLKIYIKNNIKKLIIFEAIAVNVGSLLTPIGNPPNLFLWHQWGISFFEFIIKMFPLFILLFLTLMIFIFAFFPSKKLLIEVQDKETEANTTQFYLSITLLGLYVLAAELKLLYSATFIIFIIYAVLFHEILKKVDWFLIILFIIMFIDFHSIGLIPIVSNFVNSFNLKSSSTIFVLSLFYSQIMSNVPSTIFMSKFSHNWLAIAYGVNVGGNGLIIGSLANIIALRLNNSRKIWIEFHKYSLLFFATTGILAYLIFFR